MMIAVIAAGVVLDLTATAGSLNSFYSEPSVAWSSDERYVVVSAQSMESESGKFVIDAQKGELTEKDDDWVKALKVVPSLGSQESPDGKATADIVLSHANGAGAWEGDTWKRGEGASTRFNVTRDGATFTSVYWEKAAQTVEPHWSPSGRRIFWLAMEPWHGVDGATSYGFAVGPGGGPRIQLLANKSLVKNVMPSVAAELDAAGYPPMWQGPAKSTRKSTVIYASPVAQSAAKKIARAIPGGATVEALTWKTNVDVVIALGDSARKAKP